MPKNRLILSRSLFTSLLVLSAMTGDWRSSGGAAQGGERPLALSTGDFDEDGVADLIIGAGGVARLAVDAGPGPFGDTLGSGPIQVAAVAPGLFAANSTGTVKVSFK